MPSPKTTRPAFLLFVLFLVIAGVLLLLVTRVIKSRYEQEAGVYIEQALPQLSSWRVAAFARHFNPGVWRGIDSRTRQQTLQRYARLGKLQSCDRARFSNRRKREDAAKENKNVLLRNYIIKCRYENDNVLVQLTLGGHKGEYHVEKIIFIASLFDSDGSERVEVQLPPKRNINTRAKQTRDTAESFFGRVWERLLGSD